MGTTKPVSTLRHAFEPDAESPTMIVEVKQKLSNVRSLRDSLAQLAGYLGQTHRKRALLWLVDPTITRERVSQESHNLKAALRPEIAERMTVVLSREGRFEERPPELSPSDWQFLERLSEGPVTGGDSLPRPDLQSEVLRVMILRWIHDAGPVTMRWLQETVGCNYRTAAAALKRLGKAVKRHSSRQVELKYFPKEEWARLLATSDAARATRRYATQSGPARSVESLSRRLMALQRTDLAVGGVLGARHYDPELDLIGTPRLDVTVHAPEDQAGLDFLRRLDPALKEIQEPDTPAHFVLHFLRRSKPLFEKGASGWLLADPVECLLDLQEARLEPQALEFLNTLTARRKLPEPGS